MKSKNIGNKFVSNDDGVSPVIGTILMVAVVVILAAVVAAFVFGFVGNMPKAPNVAYYQVERTAADTIVITTTNPSVVDISQLVILDNGVKLTATIAEGGQNMNESQILLDLASESGLVLTDATPSTADTISIYGSVSGLAYQEIQEITV